jgi:hypothetical protein
MIGVPGGQGRPPLHRLGIGDAHYFIDFPLLMRTANANYQLLTDNC